MKTIKEWSKVPVHKRAHEGIPGDIHAELNTREGIKNIMQSMEKLFYARLENHLDRDDVFSSISALAFFLLKLAERLDRLAGK